MEKIEDANQTPAVPPPMKSKLVPVGTQLREIRDAAAEAVKYIFSEHDLTNELAWLAVTKLANVIDRYRPMVQTVTIGTEEIALLMQGRTVPISQWTGSVFLVPSKEMHAVAMKILAKDREDNQTQAPTPPPEPVGWGNEKEFPADLD